MRATVPVMKDHKQTPFIEHALSAIGSVASLVIHSVFFIAAFLLSILHIVEWQVMLLVLTTVVSLEAIYMAIFIQIAVNRNTAQLREVEEDIDEIQEDVEDIQEDVEDLQEDVEEMHDEEEKERAPGAPQRDTLMELTRDMQRILKELEELHKK